MFILLVSCVVCVAPAWSEDDDKPKLKITQVVDSPDPFSPNQDGVKDTATFHIEVAILKGVGKHRVLAVTTTIESSKEKRIRKLETRQALPEAAEDEGAGEEKDEDEGKDKGEGKNKGKDKQDKKKPRQIVALDQTWNGRDGQGHLAPDGIYSFKVKARILKIEKKEKDAEEEANAKPVTGSVTLDTTPPSVNASITPTPNANGWHNTNVTVSFSATDALAGIESVSPPVTITNEGANQSVEGAATDRAGNAASATATVNIDKTPPVFSISSPGDGTSFYTPAVILKGTVNDTLSGVAGVICGGTPATLLGTQVECTVTLTPGLNAIRTTASDVAGNGSSTALSLTNVPVPKVTVTSPAHLGYLNISPTTVTGTVDDRTATIMINSIPATNANGSFSVALPLAEGPNIISATATTAVAVGTASIEVTLDTTPPHVTITSPPDGFVTSEASISVAGNVNDLVVGTVNEQQARVTVNGTGAQVANRMFLASAVPLALGSNVIQAVAVDRVGNAATTQITVVRQPSLAQPKIQLVSGNNQVGSIGSLLAAPLVVALTDGAGSPVPNTPVIFKVTQNDGIVNGGGTSGPTASVKSDAQGQARAQWTLGMRAGAGGNTVEAYAVGFAGTALFAATGALGQPAKIVVDTGNDQIGPIGQRLPKPFIAVVVDNGHNRVGGTPVTFTVKQGGGTFDGQPSLTVTTDSDGRVAATLTLGLQEGNANHLVEANFPNNQGFPATFTASGRAPGDPAQTKISGVVLDNSDNPIPGVTVRAVPTHDLNANPNVVQTVMAVQTNAQGQFAISPAPVGFVKLLADGSTAQRPGSYPSLEYDLVTVAGQNNTVAQPIYLLRLNTANQLCVTATSGGGTLTIPEAPGFSLTFGPGQVTFPGGSKTGCVNVTVVHGDKVPMAPGFGQQPRFIVTIQPAGAVFNPPAPITLPNVDGLQPRAVTEMYSFDHDIGSFVAIGTGVVSDDGLVIRSSPGVGVLKAGWHCGGNPTTTGSAATCPECQKCQTNQCVADTAQNLSSCSDDGNRCTLDTCLNGACEHLGLTDEQNKCCSGNELDPNTQCCEVAGLLPKTPIADINQCPRRQQISGFDSRTTDGCSSPLGDNPTDPTGLICPDASFATGDPNNPRACDFHDFCYRACHTSGEGDPSSVRAQCDGNFLSDLTDICLNLPPGQFVNCGVRCLNFAGVYFGAVKVFGGSAYNGNQKRACQCCP